MTPEEALSLIITLDLTKEAYKTLRLSAKMHNHELYPSYHRVLEVKKQFYPEEISITDKKCEVPLQKLLNKTCESV
ncbi:hypothetical protein KPH14_012977, partial [Odynerus spinipes]